MPGPEAITAVAQSESGKSHLGILLLCVISLFVTMTYQQTVALETTSIQVVILQVSTAFLPLFNLKRTLDVLLGRAVLLAIFGITAGLWNLGRADFAIVLEMGLFILVYSWISADGARLNIDTMVNMFLVFIVIGIFVKIFTDLNFYGLVPGYSLYFETWKVSFFPNIGYSAFFSLAIFLLLCRSWDLVVRHPAALALSIYFILFSGIRTALIGVLMYLGIRWLLDRRFMSTTLRIFLTVSIIAIGANLAIALSPLWVVQIQHLPLVSDLFLKGGEDLSIDEIFYQMYRPWLWMQQWNLFITSPYLMGLGTFEFQNMNFLGTDNHVIGNGTESLPTRFLAIYGLPGALFSVYCFQNLWRRARERDLWACACFPIITLLLLQWGSVFHPTDAIGIFFMLMVVHGTKAYVVRPNEAVVPVAALPAPAE